MFVVLTRSIQPVLTPTTLCLILVQYLSLLYFYSSIISTLTSDSLSRSLQPLLTRKKLCIEIEPCQEIFESLIIYFDNNVHCTTTVITTSGNTYEVMHQNMIPSSRILYLSFHKHCNHLTFVALTRSLQPVVTPTTLCRTLVYSDSLLSFYLSIISTLTSIQHHGHYNH